MLTILKDRNIGLCDPSIKGIICLSLAEGEMRELEFIPDSLLQPSSDKMAFIDRLANSITKRKRSTPQKFVGEHLVSVQTGLRELRKPSLI